jgi:hypothetical protein
LISGASHFARKSISNSYEVVAEIVRRNPSIESVTVVSYEENLSWRDAVDLENPAVPLRLKGLQQDQGSRILTKLPRADISEDKLYEITRDIENDRLIGACSNVQLDNGRLAHIPMMDFMCSPSKENLAVLARLIGNLRQGAGCLLHSGNSYHYYGFRLLSSEEWNVFLGKCLLMSGFADDRYIGHQLVDGYCVLRLSSGKLKNCVPTVVVQWS